MNYTEHFAIRAKKVSKEHLSEAEETVTNNAGGEAFLLDEFAMLDRFLILGSEDGTYYVGEKELTVQNAKNLLKCIEKDGVRAVERILEISQSGRAPKNDAAIFALAVAAGVGNDETRKAALDSLSLVARTGTHLFKFIEFVQRFRGWGRGLKRAVANWYESKSPDKLAYQAMKYKQRDGWEHRDLLRLAHISSDKEKHRDLYNWICANDEEGRKLSAMKKFPQIKAFEEIRGGKKSVKDTTDLIMQHKLPRETVPSEMLNEKEIWEALLIDMPLTALIRNLGKMSSIGLLTEFSDAEGMVLEKLNDAEYLKKSRVHPLSMLSALSIYKSGHGVRGKLSWQPTTRILESLEQGFYKAFDNVEPTGKRIMLAVDISGSMYGTPIAGSGLNAGEAAIAMAMITNKVEQNAIIKAFSQVFVNLNITSSMSIEQAIAEAKKHAFGATDCAQPMIYAHENQMPVDAFVVLTDNETWCGWISAATALKEYRTASGIDAKLVVVGMAATPFTIADPRDPGMLDVVGFDTATPNIISEFIRGQI